MKSRYLFQRPCHGYSVAETFGVLSVIAIMASMLVPKIMNAIDDAKLVADISSIKNVRTGAEDYYRKYGKFAGPGGTALTFTENAYEYWDRNVLLPEQFMVKAMKSKLASLAYVRVVTINASASADPMSSGSLGHLPDHNGNNGIYDLTSAYSSISVPEENRMYAWTRTPPGGWATGTRSRADGSVWRPACDFVGLGGNDFGIFPGGRRSHARLGPVSFGGWNRISHWIDLAQSPFISPLQACYSVPPGWDVPPAGTGGGGSGGGGSHSSRPAAHNDANVGRVVVELVMEGVTVVDAYRLSLAIDGPTQSNWAYWDILGRVKYDMYGGSGGTYRGEVFIYLGHGNN